MTSILPQLETTSPKVSTDFLPAQSQQRIVANMSQRSVQYKQMRKMRNLSKKNLTSTIDTTKSLEIKNLVLSPAREKYSLAISDNFEHQYLNVLYPDKALVKSQCTQTVKAKKKLPEARVDTSPQEGLQVSRAHI